MLTSLTKLSSRPRTTSPQRERIAAILGGFSTSPELEIQQRSVEFASLFNQGEIFVGVLERMPAPELKATVIGVVSENKPVGSLRTDVVDMIDLEDGPSTTTAVNGQNGGPATDLASMFGLGGANAGSPSAAPAGKTQKSAIDDILGLFDSTPSTAAPAPSVSLFNSASPPPQPQRSASSLFEATPVAAPAPAPAPRLTAYTAYDKNEVKITLTPQVSAAKPGLVNILARFQITGLTPASGFNFQAAVPKTQQLQMLPMSSPDINPGATETQQMRVMAPAGAQVRLRLRISFTMSGQVFQDQVDFAGFPPGLTAGQ